MVYHIRIIYINAVNASSYYYWLILLFSYSLVRYALVENCSTETEKKHFKTALETPVNITSYHRLISVQTVARGMHHW